MRITYLHIGDTVTKTDTGNKQYKVIDTNQRTSILTLQLNGNEPFKANKIHCTKVITINETQQKIFDAVCTVYELKNEQLLSKRRMKPIPDAKKAAWLLMREKDTVCEISDIFDNGHSNISIAVDTAKLWLKSDKRFKDKFERVLYELTKCTRLSK
ncbi:MAG TPA: hypothetical protein VIK86_05485 [Candidatus Paceibacterota bacterium]